MSNWAEAQYVIDAIKNQLGGGLDKDQYVLRASYYNSGPKFEDDTKVAFDLLLPEGFAVKKFVIVDEIPSTWRGLIVICGVYVREVLGPYKSIPAGTEYQVPPNTTNISAIRTPGNLGRFTVDIYIERQTIV